MPREDTMRLIDAKALYKKLNDIRKDEILLYGRLNNKNCCTLDTALFAIDFAPTIKQETKTALWVENEKQNHVEKMYHCSECGFNAWGRHEKTNFCGGCGARMENAYEGD